MNPLEKLKEKLRVKPSMDEIQYKKVEIVIPLPNKQENVNLSKMTIIDATKESNFDIENFRKRKAQTNVSKTVLTPTMQKAKEIQEEAQKKSEKSVKKKLTILNEEDEFEATELKEGEGEPAIPIPIPIPTQPLGVEGVKKEREKTMRRIAPKVDKGVSVLPPETWIQIGNTNIISRLPPKKQKVQFKASSYYMNNREIFVNFINSLFNPYREDILSDTANISCDTIGKVGSDEIELLGHQKMVRDYLNLYTPYRGLLLYHSLGSGKSLSSIAIAEGMKDSKKVIIMTPASLEPNYRIELKKFDPFYKSNQYWEWIDIKKNPEALETLSSILSLPIDYINKKKGAWLVDVTKPAEENALDSEQKASLEDQINKMIETKYQFLHYNGGITKEKLKRMTQDFTVNIFDNSVIIIDEAHNLISRIVNKINKEKEIEFNHEGKKPALYHALNLIIYEMLMTATNCRIVLLTGTPVVNYPNEIGILFNILRGYIKTWEIPLDTSSFGSKKVDKEMLRQLLEREKIMDYMDYSSSSKLLTITRNPFGFENKIKKDSGYMGITNESKESKNAEGEVVMEERGTLSDSDFQKKIIGLLNKNGIEVIKGGIKIHMRKALPDKLEPFSDLFIEEGTINIKNSLMFQKRIMGLTSYFRSAQESLLPKYEKIMDFHVVKIPMSNYQFSIYESARQEEREQEEKNKKKQKVKDSNGIFIEPTSTYRIFSRLYCNSVMPAEIPRPLPRDYRDYEDAQKEEKKANKIEREEKKKQKEEEAKQKEEEHKKKEEEKEAKKREKEDEKKRKEEEKKRKEEEKKNKKGGMVQDDDVEQGNEDKGDKGEGEGEGDEGEGEKGEGDKGEEKEPSKNGALGILYDHALKAVNKGNDNDNEVDDEPEGDEVLARLGDASYADAIKKTIQKLRAESNKFLNPEALKIYSPKFLAMLENIEDPDHPGLHLVYSQFRTLEGIGNFTIVLEENGFTQFKIKKDVNDVWKMDIAEKDKGKPTFGLYTGTESSEEKEIIRKIYNGSWDEIPPSLSLELNKISPNNDMGEVIKIFMITASGSEGINLRNTRYVHIMDPYWHPARLEQVIGRARRICSHKNLPEELQTVEVFLYLMTLSKEQIASDEARELKVKDKSKREYDVVLPSGKVEKKYLPFTSDEALFEISTIKEEFSTQLMKSIKESSIDCAIYSKRDSKEQLQCLSFGNPSPYRFSYNPSISNDETDSVALNNKKRIEWRGVELRIDGKDYIYRKIDETHGEVYDVESYMRALEVPGDPILIGIFDLKKKTLTRKAL